jgi:20S proteasome subunit beta 1
METGESPLVNTAAYLAKSIVYNNKEQLMASLIVAGWDKQKGGQVYIVPIGGMIARKSIHISGSGSIYAMGYLDANYRPGMSQDECLQLAINGLYILLNCQVNLTLNVNLTNKNVCIKVLPWPSPETAAVAAASDTPS